MTNKPHTYFHHLQPSESMVRLVAALRRVIKAMHHVHPGHAGDDAAAAAEQLADELESAGSLGIRQESLLRHTRSPLSGVMNPMAPPMTSEYHPDEKRVVSSILFNEAYQGPPACVHGGFVAALLDEALGRTRHLTDRNCVTGSLLVTYRRPTPVNVPLTVDARITEMHDRKMVVRGEILANGEVTAVGEGTFVFLETEKFNALVTDARNASK
ncbi:MAG: PaaI family thioesterase [Actinobacteria bacterium]|jgi:acyl-coenzyme A thioesterase PaaI-like protein|nr:PaaI family thioesterase [Actinomycetota bacterium]